HSTVGKFCNPAAVHLLQESRIALFLQIHLVIQTAIILQSRQRVLFFHRSALPIPPFGLLQLTILSIGANNISVKWFSEKQQRKSTLIIVPSMPSTLPGSKLLNYLPIYSLVTFQESLQVYFP